MRVRTFRLSSATTRLATPILLSLYLYYTLFMQLIGAPPRVCGMYVWLDDVRCKKKVGLPCAPNVRIGAVFRGMPMSHK